MTAVLGAVDVASPAGPGSGPQRRHRDRWCRGAAAGTSACACCSVDCSSPRPSPRAWVCRTGTEEDDRGPEPPGAAPAVGRRAAVLVAMRPPPYALATMTWLTSWSHGIRGRSRGDARPRPPGVRDLARAGRDRRCLVDPGADLPPGRGVAVPGRPCHAAGRSRSRSPASMVVRAPRAASTIPIVSSDCSDVAALVLMIPAPGWGPARRPSRRTPASGGGVGAGRTVERANHLRPADLRHRMPEHVTTRGHRD